MKSTSGNGYYNNVLEKSRIERVAECWQMILRAQPLLVDEQQIHSVQKDLVNQRVVNLDVIRTRVSMMDPVLTDLLEKGLTLFCKRNGVQYKQGINQIMIPFLTWSRCHNVRITTVYNCFQSFFKKFLLNLYFDEEFNSLELLFRMITIILKYHDPALARFLFQNDITPELYSTAWFMTLFANKLSLEILYFFWEAYIVEDDEFFIFYVIVGLLLYNRYKLLQTREAQLPQFITELSFGNSIQLFNVLKISLLVRKHTPKSLFLLCKQKRLFQRCQDYKNVKKLLQNIENINLFLILPEQIVDSIYGSSEVCRSMNCKNGNCYFCRINSPIDSGPYQRFVEKDTWLSSIITLSNDIRGIQKLVKFVILDIRIVKQKILVDSELINITAPMQTIEEAFFRSFLQSRGKIHFIFLFTKFRFDSLEDCEPQELDFCKRFIGILYSAGFQFMSILEGGFYDLEKAIRQQMQRPKIPQETKSQIFKKKYCSMIKAFEQMNNAQTTEYYKQNGLIEKITLNIFPSMLFTLEKLAQNSQFVISETNILLITEKFCINFKKNQLLKDVLVFLNNSKSLTEYFLSGMKSQSAQDTLQVQSVYLLKDLQKLSTKQSAPGLLFLYFKVYSMSPQSPLFNRHICSLSSKYMIHYIACLQDLEVHQIYDEVGKGEFTVAKKKIMCDPAQLNEYVEYIKGKFNMTARKYKEYRRSR